MLGEAGREKETKRRGKEREGGKEPPGKGGME
jgi:hypothetical protein